MRSLEARVAWTLDIKEISEEAKKQLCRHYLTDQKQKAYCRKDGGRGE